MALSLGAQLRLLGVEHRHLTLRGFERRLAVRQIGLEALGVGIRLLDLLPGAEGAGQQRLLTRRLLAGANDIGLGRRDRVLASAICACCKAFLVFRFSIAASAPSRSAWASSSRAR